MKPVAKKGLGFSVQGLGVVSWGSRIRDLGLWGSGFASLDSGIWGCRPRVQGFRPWGWRVGRFRNSWFSNLSFLGLRGWGWDSRLTQPSILPD